MPADNNKEETSQTPKKNPKKIIFIAIAVIAIAVALKMLFFRSQFYYAGTIEATKVDVSAQVSSTLSKVLVREGDHVTEKNPLIELSCEDIRVASNLANVNYTRQSKLLKAGAGPQEAFDTAKNRKDDADVKMNWCNIQSPLTGTVLNRYHEPGELVTPGVKLLTLANIKDVWAYIYVPQPTVSYLKPGMKIKTHIPEMPNREFTGTIIKINDEAEFTPKNVQTRTERERLIYGVKVSFLGVNEEEILKPGMTVEAELPQEALNAK